jgi:hypothetical protein
VSGGDEAPVSHDRRGVTVPEPVPSGVQLVALKMSLISVDWCVRGAPGTMGVPGDRWQTSWPSDCKRGC